MILDDDDKKFLEELKNQEDELFKQNLSLLYMMGKKPKIEVTMDKDSYTTTINISVPRKITMTDEDKENVRKYYSNLFQEILKDLKIDTPKEDQISKECIERFKEIFQDKLLKNKQI